MNVSLFHITIDMIDHCYLQRIVCIQPMLLLPIAISLHLSTIIVDLCGSLPLRKVPRGQKLVIHFSKFVYKKDHFTNYLSILCLYLFECISRGDYKHSHQMLEFLNVENLSSAYAYRVVTKVFLNSWLTYLKSQDYGGIPRWRLVNSV